MMMIRKWAASTRYDSPVDDSSSYSRVEIRKDRSMELLALKQTENMSTNNFLKQVLSDENKTQISKLIF